MASSTGPSIVVKVLSDLTNFSGGIDALQGKVLSTSGRMRTAISGAFQGLQQTGVAGPIIDSFNTLDSAIANVVKEAGGVPEALLGVGTAVAGIGAGLQQLGSKDQAAQQQLQQAVQATGQDYGDYSDKVEEAIKHQEHFGDTANETSDALRILTEATHDPQKALDLLGETTDLAAAKHESLDKAATSMGRTFNGNVKVLREFGVSAEKASDNTAKVDNATRAAAAADKAAADAKQHLQDLQARLGPGALTISQQQQLRDATQKVTDANGAATEAHKKLSDMQLTVVSSTQAGTDNLDRLSKVLSGQGAAAADTFAGKMDHLKAHVEDSIAQFGTKYGPAIQTAGLAMVAMGSAMEVIPVLIEGINAAFIILDSVILPTILPILGIVAAVAAVIAIGYVLYRNWDTIWGFIKKIVGDAVDFIKDHWKLLITIILGPFGLVVALIATYWDQIKAIVLGLIDVVSSVVQTVVGYVMDVVNVVVAVFTAIFDVLHTIIDSWVGRIEALISNIVQWITDAFSVVVGILTVPFNIAREIITGAINGILAVVGTIGAWVSAAVSTVVAILSVPFGIARDLITAAINGFLIVIGTIGSFVSNAVGAVANLLSGPFDIARGWISGAIDAIKGFVSAIPDAISSALEGAENLIAAPFRLAQQIIDDIVGHISDAVGKITGPISSVIGGVGKIGGFIAGLAEGGIVTKPTLAVIGEAGPEAVIPLRDLNPDPARLPTGPVAPPGPAVVIQNATFTDEADMEALMRQAAWATRTRAV